jgi:hypothetical protein
MASGILDPAFAYRHYPFYVNLLVSQWLVEVSCIVRLTRIVGVNNAQ